MWTKPVVNNANLHLHTRCTASQACIDLLIISDLLPGYRGRSLVFTNPLRHINIAPSRLLLIEISLFEIAALNTTCASKKGVSSTPHSRSGELSSGIRSRQAIVSRGLYGSRSTSSGVHEDRNVAPVVVQNCATHK
jgi:hypothetical protein